MSIATQLLGISFGVIFFVILGIAVARSGRKGANRSIGAVLNPLSHLIEPTKRQALAHVEQMEVAHDKEDDGEGNAPPEDEPEADLERQVRKQLTSPEAYLNKRGARGKEPDNGARV
jgi:hypothetical protein